MKLVFKTFLIFYQAMIFRKRNMCQPLDEIKMGVKGTYQHASAEDFWFKNLRISRIPVKGQCRE